MCVGWADDPERSVEFVEAALGGWRETPGIENLGDKEQREPCRRCALRTRCGGAWRDYWEILGGRGIHAPIEIVEPWRDGAAGAPGQTIVEGTVAASLAALAQAVTPTVWLRSSGLDAGDARRLACSGCTDLSLDLDASGLASGRAVSRATLVTLREARELARASAGAPPSRRLRVHVRTTRGTAGDRAALAAWTSAELR